MTAVDWIDTLVPGGSRQLTGDPILVQGKAIETFVIHTTETSGYPAYPKGNAPHVTIHPKARTFRQHFPLSAASYSLRAQGIQTNTWGVLQIEVVGYASQPTAYTPDDLAYIGQVVRAMIDGRAIPVVSTVRFAGSEAYGVNGAVRMTNSQWQAYKGFCGHQHVPGGNSHWDPGAIDINAWLAAISGSTPPSPGPGPARLVVDGVWGGETTGWQQRIAKTPFDKVISHQWKSAANQNILSMQFDTTGLGSTLGAWIQRILAGRGLYTGRQDGLLGSGSITGMQRFYGTPADGVVSPGRSTLVVAIQNEINAGSFLGVKG